MHNIVVLGGNFSGVSIAHYLLRHVFPSLNSANNSGSAYKVTLVSPSDHTYWKVGAPRIIGSGKIPINNIFASIPDAFSNYKTSEFTFIQGEAVGVDEATKVVSIKSVGTSAPTSVRYDSLVIATGTTANAVWTLNGEQKLTVAALEDLHIRLPKAKSIVVAGGGPSGVETAADIAFHHPGKDITLLSGTTRLLSRLQHKGAPVEAERKLSALGVKTIHNVRVSSATKGEDGSKTALQFSDGSSRVVDVYLDATGGTPNTSFLPASWLNETTKRVATDGTTLRTLKAPAGVYCIGDAASYSKGGIPDALWAVAPLGYSIWYDLKSSLAAADGKGSSSVVEVKPVLKEKKYKQVESDVQVVPIGPKGGVGVIFGWRLPSFFVWLLKSRTFMIEKAPELALGGDFSKP